MTDPNVAALLTTEAIKVAIAQMRRIGIANNGCNWNAVADDLECLMSERDTARVERDTLQQQLQEHQRNAAECRAQFVEARVALAHLRAALQQLQAEWQTQADRRGRGQTVGLPSYRVLENCAGSLRDLLVGTPTPKILKGE